MRIEFKADCTDNAAFQDGQKEYELARILRRVADEIEGGSTYGVMHDVNGNRVGTWEA